MRDHLATLSQALVDGVFEEPLWSTFLEQLRVITGATIATLVYQSPQGQVDEAIYLMSGGPSPQSARDSFRQFRYPDNVTRRLQAEDGRVYSLSEVLAMDGPRYSEFFDHFIREVGMTDVRRMRVQEASGIDAWLSVSRRGGRFGKRDTDLFTALAPMLRGVLRSHVASERHRFAAELSGDAVRRMQFGWIALDREGMVLDTDQFGAHMLDTSDALFRNATGQLTVSTSDRQKALDRAISSLSHQPAARPRALQLRGDPWLDMLLVGARNRHVSAQGTAAVIAYVHGDTWSSEDRQQQLAELFHLGNSEARLALAICRGKSIAEAAAEMGVTLSTARTYSKAIFAKTGARGQADLVRIVLGSVLALAV